MVRAARREPGTLVICSHGMNAWQMTLETAAALRECEAVYSDCLGPDTKKSLEQFCPPIVLVEDRPGRRSGAAGLLLRRVRKGARVAYLTYGDPGVYSEKVDELVRRCARERLRCVVYPAVSSLNALLSGMRMAQSGAGGFFTTCAADFPASRPDAACLVFLFGNGGPGLRDRFLRLLARLYDPGHEVWLLRVDAMRSARVRRVRSRVGDLRAAWDESGRERTTLYIPR